MKQSSLFDGSKPFKFTKPIRLIELFAGYGSQNLACKYLNANYSHYKICEWAVNSIQAYKDAHFSNVNTDYTKDMTKEQLVEKLHNYGISANYNEPMQLSSLKRKSIDWLRNVYNNIKITDNLVNIQNVKGSDLQIVDTDKYDYLVTYSFPCQDLSKAGKGKGMSRDSRTRSGMLWEVERILEETEKKPQVLLMENVPDVSGTKNMPEFSRWIQKLESLDYKNYFENLNSKDFGVPQSRNRTFMVSILGDYDYMFPQKKILDKRLKDVLEKNVDESYYLNNSKISQIQSWKSQQNQLEDAKTLDDDYSQTITAKSNTSMNDSMVLLKEKTNKRIVVGKTSEAFNHDTYIYSTKGISGTITTQNPGYKNKILETSSNKTKKEELCERLSNSGILKNYTIINHSYTNSSNNPKSRTKLEHYIERGDGISPTLTTRPDILGIALEQPAKWTKTQKSMLDEKGNIKRYLNSKVVDKFEDGDCADISFPNGYNKGNRVFKGYAPALNTTTTQSSFISKQNFRIRKLTPKECFRLMGVKDKDFDNIAKNQSNASLYHLAGDSIVVDVLMAIINQML